MGWDDRFGGEEYLFGTEPAAFVAAQAGLIPPGSRVLSVCDGEGRNSAWLAALGHEVTAFDLSPVGVAKARRLADDRGVSVTHHVAGIEAWDWTRPFDAVVAVFVQFAPPDLRDRFLGWMGQAVRPGGLILLHGYAPRQVGYGTGGPAAPENMYTLPLLAQAFAGWEVLRAADYDAVIEEGAGHSGLSALIDFVARKPG
jgi:SAM-dependent methyltransferase